MSRAYREAKGDIVWIIDCNVWISAQVAGRMVDLLCGLTPTAPGRKYKFVHQLPLVVDVSVPPTTDSDILSQISEEAASPEAQSTPPISTKGGLLEELFLSTSHAKFYVAISTVAIAPCIVGKSNMFRRSHLNALTATSSDPNFPERQLRRAGIDYFSDNICEDHLIGDLLWKSPVPASIQAVAQREGRDPAEQPSNSQRQKISWGHHGLLPPHPSNLATQPTMNLSLSSYTARRIRWLRARKFTVPVATLVEAGTESLLCSIFGAWGLTTLPWCNHVLGIPQNWTAFFAVFAVSIGAWAVVDRWVWNMLQHGGSEDAERPIFGRARGEKRAGKQWLLAWCGREALAFPIWLSAVFGGVTVAWRGRRFWVGLDMRVHEIGDKMDGKRKA